MEKIKKIWAHRGPIGWWIFLISWVLFSGWANYEHAQNDNKADAEASFKSMEIGRLLTINIIGKSEIKTKKQFDSVFTIRAKEINNRVYYKNK